jgi:hypothetical protein
MHTLATGCRLGGLTTTTESDKPTLGIALEYARLPSPDGRQPGAAAGVPVVGGRGSGRCVEADNHGTAVRVLCASVAGQTQVLFGSQSVLIANNARSE